MIKKKKEKFHRHAHDCITLKYMTVTRTSPPFQKSCIHSLLVEILDVLEA